MLVDIQETNMGTLNRVRYQTTLWLAGLLFGIPLCTTAGIDQFVGEWKNVDPNARGISKIQISSVGGQLKVHVFGNCRPQECDWGEVAAQELVPDFSSNLSYSTQAVSAQFLIGLSRVIVLVHLGGRGQLMVEALTFPPDGSGRARSRDVFVLTRTGVLIREDCIRFNPDTATAAYTNIRGRGASWKVVDGDHLMFDFGADQEEAERTLAVIKHYGMNQSCFVGRPNPQLKFMYALVSGAPPTGAMPGEECESLNPITLSLIEIGGSWIIADGGRWLFNFGEKERDARMAFEIINSYQFTESCRVGQSSRGLLYLRK
jgi:hypothetical protein